MSEPSMGATRALARFVAGLRYEDLPDDVAQLARLAVKDILGVAVFSGKLPWSQMAAELAHDEAPDGTVTVWATGGRTAPALAALANGTAAHGVEMDDRSHNLDIHNGAPTVPATLALAEHFERSGKDVIAAIVAGYEVGFRVARATFRTMDRFYWVSIRSIFGATAASARVAGLDDLQTANALGIAGYMASGLWEHTQDPQGNMVKRLQGGGWPAHCAVTAVLLARKGFEGPKTILEGTRGVCRSFSTKGEPDLAALDAGLGESFEMRFWEPKYYATRGELSPAVDAVQQLKQQDDLAIDDIRSIRAGCSARVLQQVSPWSGGVTSVTAAQQSLPFLVAAAFLYDLRDPAVWDGPILTDERVLELMSRVETEVDDEIEQIDSGQREPAGIRVTVQTDGGSRDVWARYDKGRPENPVTEDEIDAKFALLTAHGLSDEPRQALRRFVDTLGHDDAPVDLTFLGADRTVVLR